MHAVKETMRGDGYFDQMLGVHLVSVMAGVYHWTRSENIAFATTLGSCLSVCAYDRVAGVGGMNHFLLPKAPEREEAKFSESFRYGSAAIETLLNSLYNKGAAKNGMTIKIFGGGKVLNGVSQDIGQKNIDFAKRFFQSENMRIDGADVGGTFGRRVIFFPRTGKVLVRQLGDTNEIKKIAETELNVLNALSGKRDESDVELF
jgi:chemotaxis protein CheD